jgi:multidrug resistance efflux pump
MRRAGRLLVAVVVLAVLELTAFAATYTFHTRFYVSTDNAQIEADRVDINAPATGILNRWNITEGTSLRRGQVLGSIHGVGGGRRPARVIKASRGATVGLTVATPGTFVQQGQLLAAGFDLANVWVTARIPESEISRVAVGDPADIHLDAFPDAVIPGVVTKIRAATAGSLEVYPSPDIDPTNVQKIDQYVPVRITPYPTAIPLTPGLNASVQIRVTY